MRLFILAFLLTHPAWARPDVLDLSADLAGILDQNRAVPSLAVHAVHKGTPVANGQAGLRKKGERDKVTSRDQYHLGSCTKAMTATLAAIMVREGTIKWSTGPEDVLRGVKLHAGYEGLTLEQLLSNTGGCPGAPPAPVWARAWEAKGSEERQRLELARSILQAPPAYPPGEGYTYSNAGFAIAGAMLESAAKKAYEDLLTEKVFQPLGMSSAGFRAPGRNGKVLHPYGHNPNPVDPEPRGDNPSAIAPAGAVHCTLEDWGRFAAAHLGHGPGGFLTDEERRYLHTPRSKERNYALGWLVGKSPHGGRSLAHDGSNTMWYCSVTLLPDAGLAILAASNIGKPHGDRAVNAATALLLERCSAGH